MVEINEIRVTLDKGLRMTLTSGTCIFPVLIKFIMYTNFYIIDSNVSE